MTILVVRVSFLESRLLGTAIEIFTGSSRWIQVAEIKAYRCTISSHTRSVSWASNLAGPFTISPIWCQALSALESRMSTRSSHDRVGPRVFSSTPAVWTAAGSRGGVAGGPGVVARGRAGGAVGAVAVQVGQWCGAELVGEVDDRGLPTRPKDASQPLR
jgi:hypothetical protein